MHNNRLRISRIKENDNMIQNQIKVADNTYRKCYVLANEGNMYAMALLEILLIHDYAITCTQPYNISLPYYPAFHIRDTV
jgi:hypothetical protein